MNKRIFAGKEFDVHPIVYEGKNIGSRLYKESYFKYVIIIDEYEDGYDFVFSIKNSISENRNALISFDQYFSREEMIETGPEWHFKSWLSSICKFLDDTSYDVDYIKDVKD